MKQEKNNDRSLRVYSVNLNTKIGEEKMEKVRRIRKRRKTMRRDRACIPSSYRTRCHKAFKSPARLRADTHTHAHTCLFLNIYLFCANLSFCKDTHTHTHTHQDPRMEWSGRRDPSFPATWRIIFVITVRCRSNAGLFPSPS